MQFFVPPRERVCDGGLQDQLWSNLLSLRRRFTWYHSNRVNMSRLDQILLSAG